MKKYLIAKSKNIPLTLLKALAKSWIFFFGYEMEKPIHKEIEETRRLRMFGKI